MPDDNSLSLESAVSIMTNAAAPPASGTGTPAAEPDKKDNAAAAATGQDAPATDNPTPADNGGADDALTAAATTDQPAQGDAPATTDGNGEQGTLPPLDAPDGWTAEEKAAFTASPRKAQEAILRREQDRNAALRNGQNDVAEQRKAAAAEATRLKELNARMDDVVQDHVNTLVREFPEIKTQADIDGLAARDPARFAQFQAALMRFNSVNQAKQDAKNELQASQQKQFNEQLFAAKTSLLKIFPTWQDTNVLKKEMVEIQDYAISQGLSEQEARTAIHPILYSVAHKAMLYDRAQADLAKARNRTPAPVVAPGTSSATPRQDKAAADNATAMRKLAQSGSIDDALALMRAK